MSTVGPLWIYYYYYYCPHSRTSTDRTDLQEVTHIFSACISWLKKAARPYVSSTVWVSMSFSQGGNQILAKSIPITMSCYIIKDGLSVSDLLMNQSNHKSQAEYEELEDFSTALRGALSVLKISRAPSRSKFPLTEIQPHTLHSSPSDKKGPRVDPCIRRSQRVHLPSPVPSGFPSIPCCSVCFVAP